MEVQDLFGVNATQNSQVLTILKSDLPRLTPSSNNSAESLLVGIILRAASFFNGLVVDSNGEALIDSDGEYLNYSAENDYDIYLCFWRSYYSFPYAMRQFVFKIFTST